MISTCQLLILTFINFFFRCCRCHQQREADNCSESGLDGAPDSPVREYEQLCVFRSGRGVAQPDSPPDPKGSPAQTYAGSQTVARSSPDKPRSQPEDHPDSEQLFGSRSRSQPDHQCAIEIVRKLRPRSGQVQTPIMPTFNYFCILFGFFLFGF